MELESTMIACQSTAWELSSLAMENLGLRGQLELRPRTTTTAQQMEQLLAEGRWRSNQLHCSTQTIQSSLDVAQTEIEMQRLQQDHDVQDWTHHLGRRAR